MDHPAVHWFTASGPEPLVLLHGFTQAAASWTEVATALAEHPPRSAICAVALPGHHPAVPVAAGWAANIDHLDEILSYSTHRAPATGVHLCGYSLGARAALGWAVRHPDRIARLTLIGVHPGLPHPVDRAARRDADFRWIARLRDDGLEAFVTAWENLTIFADQSDLPGDGLARQRAIRLGHDPAGLAASLAHMGLAEMPDYRDDLARLAVPITLVTGARDRKFTELARELVRPGVEHVTVAESGHNVVLEKPRAVLDVLRSASR